MTYSRRSLLTVSSALTFKRCPLQFKMRFVDGLPDDDGDDTTARDIGTEFHRYAAARFGDSPAPVTERIADLVAALESMMDEDAANFSIFDHIGTPDTVLTEHEFRVSSGDGVEVMAGTADMVIRSSTGIVVRDWKTGGAWPTQIAEDLQTAFYGYCLSKPGDVVVLERWYIAHEKIQRLVTTHDGCAWAYAEMCAVSNAVADAQESGEWAAKPGAACAWCGVRKHCPAWQLPTLPLPGQIMLDTYDKAAELARVARLAKAKLAEIDKKLREFVDVNGPIFDETTGETLAAHLVTNRDLDSVAAIRALLDNGVSPGEVLCAVKITKDAIKKLAAGNRPARDAALACVTESESTKFEWRAKARA